MMICRQGQSIRDRWHTAVVYCTEVCMSILPSDMLPSIPGDGCKVGWRTYVGASLQILACAKFGLCYMLGDCALRCCAGRVTLFLFTSRYRRAVAIHHNSCASPCPGICSSMDMDPRAAVHCGLHRRHHRRHIWRPDPGGWPRRLGL